MNTGGYQIINLENRPLTLNVGMVYDGIYDKIERTTKAILITGLTVNGFEKRDEFCTVTLSGSGYVLHTRSYDITINDIDVVMCKLPESGGGLILYDFTTANTINIGITGNELAEKMHSNIIMVRQGLNYTVMTALYEGTNVALSGKDFDGNTVSLDIDNDSTTLSITLG